MMSADSTNIPGLDTILRGEIMRKDGLISQLVGQNKELMAAKDRQDIELTAQRETIQVLIVAPWQQPHLAVCRSTELTLTCSTPRSPTRRPTSSGWRRSRGR